MHRRRKSLVLIERVNRARKLLAKAEEQFYCYRLDEIELKYDDAHKELMNSAQASVSDAEEKMRTVYKDLIGKAIMREIYSGDWDGGR